MAMRSFPAKLTSKAQITLPLEIRKSLGPGDRIEFFLHRTGEVFVLPRNRPAAAILGKGAAFARPVTREESDRLVGKAIAARGKAASPQPSPNRRKAG
jgi:bifunctional DNA-binding transcriptional regulator/antitoxin component of YhaV-PrlF toxin-antitoxin module